MHRSQFGDGWQRDAATDVSHSPHAAFATHESLTISHHLTDRGADVHLAQADQLQTQVVQFVEALLLSAVCRPSLETVGFARREEIVQHLAQSLAALAMEQEQEATVFDSGTSITIPVTLGDGGSVIVVMLLRWKDRYSPTISEVVCRSTIDVSEHDRESYGAWLSEACPQLERHAACWSRPSLVGTGAGA